MPYKVNVLEKPKFVKKNHTQRKHGGEEMLPHFLPKHHLKIKNWNSKTLHHVQI
jgi:hypothetical protein